MKKFFVFILTITLIGGGYSFIINIVKAMLKLEELKRLKMDGMLKYIQSI